jgi:LysM repeat protein
MRKALLGLAGILALVLSCRSTGNISAAGENGQVPPAESTESSEQETLADIYDRYDNRLILTGAKIYTVAVGDTLTRIARQNYGTGDNPYYFPLIIAASKSSVEIVDPDSIEVGMRLIIPSLQENLDNPSARTTLKNLLKDVADFYAGKNGAQSRGIYNGLTRLYNSL